MFLYVCFFLRNDLNKTLAIEINDKRLNKWKFYLLDYCY